MTVQELIELLQDYDGDAEVRLAEQPHYPFEYSVDRVASVEFVVGKRGELIDPDEYAEFVEADRSFDGGEFSDAHREWPEMKTILYIGEGDQLGYLPGAARGELGWSSR
jgi:hypothetical protein